jgi:cation-transporting ATPase 13A3/4/5
MLILYGEILAFSGMIQYYFTVQMSQALWVFIDGCTVPVSWALTLAKPALNLSKNRPTARLLGFETILSVIGPIVINISILAFTVAILYQQSFFRCFEFDGTYADLRKWWELGDNYEGAVIGVLTAFQILHTSCAMNIGSLYRKGFLKNKPYLVIYGLLVFILSLILILDPNPISCHFRINCGTKESLSSLGYQLWFNPPEEYFNASGHNVIPLYFRILLLGISFLNLIALMLWEGYVILGPVRKLAKAFADGRWQVRKAPNRV